MIRKERQEIEDIGKKQSKIIERTKMFLMDGINKKHNIASDPNYFLTCWAEGLGNLNLKKFSNYRVSNYEKLKIYFKEFFAFSKLYKTEILGKIDETKEFNNLIISYLIEGDLNKKGIFVDRYFSKSSDDEDKNIWLLIPNDENIKIPEKINSNILIFIKKNRSKLSSFFFMIKFFFILLFKSKLINFGNEFFKMISENKFYDDVILKIFDLINDFKIRTLLMPYESQPHQHKIIKEVKKNFKHVKTIGYMHSVLPGLPTDYVYRDGSPDRVLVNGEDQKDVMCNNLGWTTIKVKAISSMRYHRMNNKDLKKQIFFPYYFENAKMLYNYFENFVLNSENINFPCFEVRNHPAMKNSKKHLKLKKLIEIFIKKNPNKFLDSNNNENISIFFGSTASIIEALERDVKAFHICEKVIFDLYNPYIWKNIEIKKIDSNVYSYKLLNNGKMINFGYGSENLSNF